VRWPTATALRCAGGLWYFWRLRGHLVEEELRRKPLALQPALHVGEGEHHCVDLTLADRDPQPLQGQHAAAVPAAQAARVGGSVACRSRHQTESSRSIAASSSAEPWTFGPLNQFFAETSQ